MYKRYSMLILVIAIGMALFLSSCSSSTKDKEDSKDKNPVTSVEQSESNKQIDDSKTNGEQKDNNIIVDNNDSIDSNSSNNSNDSDANKDTDTKTNTEISNNGTTPTADSYIQIKLDKNTGEVGEIIKAEIVLNNSNSISGYQVNVKYDPKVLQAVNYDTGEKLGNKTIPSGGTIIQNQGYGVIPIAANNIEQGILNFAKGYSNLDAYRESGAPEKNGVIAVIGFKILNKTTTNIRFEDTATMSNGISGTMLFDWNGDMLSGYQIVQPQKIN